MGYISLFVVFRKMVLCYFLEEDGLVFLFFLFVYKGRFNLVFLCFVGYCMLFDKGVLVSVVDF